MVAVLGEEVAAGQPAPAFTLRGTEREWRLSDFAGSFLVLYFYPRDLTPGCTQEAQDFRDHYSAILERGGLVLGVSGDPLEKHVRFRNTLGLPFDLASDPDYGVAKAYGAFGEKVLYGKVHEGLIRTTVLIGPDLAVRRIWRKVRVKGHVEAVLAELGGAGS